MQKLLSKFRQSQAAKDALRLLTYLDRHPFAVLVSTSVEDRVLITTLQEKRARALHAVRCARAA
jgi:hypothetical protein